MAREVLGERLGRGDDLEPLAERPAIEPQGREDRVGVRLDQDEVVERRGRRRRAPERRCRSPRCPRERKLVTGTIGDVAVDELGPGASGDADGLDDGESAGRRRGRWRPRPTTGRRRLAEGRAADADGTAATALVPGSARPPDPPPTGRRRPRRAPARRRRRWRPGSATPAAGARDAWDGPRISTARACWRGSIVRVADAHGRQRTRRVEKAAPRPGGRTGRERKRGKDGGPDRIRTGDLQRDRLACWAATPRVRGRWRMIAGTP